MQPGQRGWAQAIAGLIVVASVVSMTSGQAAVPAQDTLVENVAVQLTAASTPTIIGADGPELTQVDMVHKLGLSGEDITVCVIDTGVDIKSRNFGEDCPHGPNCRIAFSYDVESQSSDVTPTDWSNAGGHGTHVSGIAVGSFPDKLKDSNGKLLPYQHGVAYGAHLGAIRASTQSSEFPYEFSQQALQKTIAQKCDVDNLSLGGFYVTPNKQLTPTIAKIREADIIITAAQGNDDLAVQTGNRVFNVASPGAFEEVFSIGHVNNTANPGSVLVLDNAVQTATGKSHKIVANQRADTRASLCTPNCDALNLPREIILIKMVTSGNSSPDDDPQIVSCDMETVTETRNAHAVGHVILLQIPRACTAYQNAEELWELLLTLKPVLVLIALPSEEDSHVGPVYYRNRETPVLWLRAADGHGLVNAMSADPSKSFRLLQVPGAELVAVKSDFAGQPASTSALGPGFDLTMKPDISAPGSLYSSLPNSTYQTWPGTSMAAPYMAGVIALWKESVKKRGIKRPHEGWIDAAHIALKNTARPVPYKGSKKLMWPPVKIGAGVVQAYDAVINRVSITPPQLLLRTDSSMQRFSLSISNKGSSKVTYQISHKPGVTLNLPKTWYGDGFDDSLPVAQVAVLHRHITVPAESSLSLEVKITVPAALKDVDGIFGGYIMFTPVTEPQAVGHISSNTYLKQKSGRVLTAASTEATPSSAVPLSVPYQGSSKDYSTLTPGRSLVLFVPPLYSLDTSSSQILMSKPSLFLCDNDGPGQCGYAESLLKASTSKYTGYRFGSTLLRPVADVKVQVWSSSGKRHLGTSPSQGPGGTAPPLRRTFLTANSWNGTYVPTSNGTDAGDLPVMQLKAGDTYTLKLELHPVLAAADRRAGREVALEPLVYELKTKLQVVDDEEQLVNKSQKDHEKVTLKSWKSGSGSSSARASARNAAHAQGLGFSAARNVVLPL